MSLLTLSAAALSEWSTSVSASIRVAGVCVLSTVHKVVMSWLLNRVSHGVLVDDFNDA